MRRTADPDTVELLWRFTHTRQPEGYRADDIWTWTVQGLPLTAGQVERIRRATLADFDALDLLLAADGVVLIERRTRLLDRAAAAGVDVGHLPGVRGQR